LGQSWGWASSVAGKNVLASGQTESLEQRDGERSHCDEECATEGESVEKGTRCHAGQLIWAGRLTPDDVVGAWIGFGTGVNKQYFIFRRVGNRLRGMCGRCFETPTEADGRGVTGTPPTTSGTTLSGPIAIEATRGNDSRS
jgi:hypothetical protein